MLTKIFAHRGSFGTHPENTMAAFREAERVGANGIELDVHLTKDNQIAVIHDNTVDRTTNGSGEVRSLTLDELRKLDAGSKYSEKFRGERILSLKEVLSWMKGNTLELNVELKNATVEYPDFEVKLLQEVQNSDLEDRVFFSSFNHYALKKMNEMNPDIECAVLYQERLYKPWDYAKTLGAGSLHPHFPNTSEDMVKEAQKNGFPVRVYTVNKEKYMEKFIRAGCAAIITDYPEKALRIRERIARR
ncbi:glycerophosphodiester phosphodiesterase [Virgibacillus indicus]|uniref:glycerophosphodiester phosphodiesterase n=1 Tax=Virgibacillus indicus TaxID=2024554 RepID=UPI001F0AFE4F|nr:glycerophosphodiester phosphodiesterase [Virgibacillus indicus]